MLVLDSTKGTSYYIFDKKIELNLKILFVLCIHVLIYNSDKAVTPMLEGISYSNIFMEQFESLTLPEIHSVSKQTYLHTSILLLK